MTTPHGFIVAIPFGSRELSNISDASNVYRIGSQSLSDPGSFQTNPSSKVRRFCRRNPFRIQGAFKPIVADEFAERTVAIPFGSRELSNKNAMVHYSKREVAIPFGSRELSNVKRYRRNYAVPSQSLSDPGSFQTTRVNCVRVVEVSQSLSDPGSFQTKKLDSLQNKKKSQSLSDPGSFQTHGFLYIRREVVVAIPFGSRELSNVNQRTRRGVLIVAIPFGSRELSNRKPSMGSPRG